jgi:hypothetical protein
MNVIKTYFCFAQWMECDKTCFDHACAGMEKSSLWIPELVLAYYTCISQFVQKISEQV